jgi:tetratricopeptide (TPR) repeat protein
MLQGCCKHVSLILLLCCSQQIGARDNPPSSVKDLQYGEMLFYYYQQDYFNSIVRLEIAQQQEHLPNHKDEAELMLGGLVLSYGMRDKARKIFQQLLDDQQNDLSVHNRAWLYLAKISYQRGDLSGALDATKKINGKMTPATRTATANLKSLLFMEEGRNAEAIEVLKSTRSGKHWTPYLKYNLGVAQIRNGNSKEGERNLESVRKSDSLTSEQRLLRDKANLALGYSYLQQGVVDKSRQALDKVRLDGPLSNKALLGAGWADADSGQFAQALVPWTELSTRNATDPAVQEALLAVPYAMAKMELYGQAIQHYKKSISALNDEKRQLDISINAIQNGELLRHLEQSDPRTGYGWLQQLDLDTDSPVLHYQVTLMASHNFQEGIKNYRDLLFLRRNLDDWATSITAYDDMLATRESRYQSHLPAVDHVLNANTIETLQQHYAALSNTVTSIESTGNSIGLANAAETRQLQTLSGIKKQLANLPDTPEIRNLRDKQKLLNGIVYWQVNSEYKQRLWQTRQQLSELETLIHQTGKATGKLEPADIETPAGFSGFDKQISNQKTALKQLQTRTADASMAQGVLLEQLAVNELEAQKKRIDTYIIQARFALAQTYDSSLSNPTDGVDQ